jgi:acyl-CoA thioester hydrolase
MAESEALALEIHYDTVTGDLLDYNGHMNVAGYMVIFDRAADVLFAQAGFSAEYRREFGGSVFALEHHIRYLREVKLGDPIRVLGQFVAADDKRIQYFMRMQHRTELWSIATLEAMSVHVDLNARRAAPMRADLRARVGALIAAAPAGVQPELGRAIAFRRA